MTVRLGRIESPLAVTACAAIAVVVWFTIVLGPFVGEAPDLDAMISLREAIVFHESGLAGLIDHRTGAGVHPPLPYLLSSLAFGVFGESPSAHQLLALPLFAILAVATERILAPWLAVTPRLLATFAASICPAIAVTIALVASEGLIVVVLAVALAITLHDTTTWRRLAVVSAVLALLPLIKETGLTLVVPFAVFVAFDERRSWHSRVARAAVVVSLPLAAAATWRAVLAAQGGTEWRSWILSSHADDGPYVVALRAMLGLEGGRALRQNLANALIVNWLWAPAVLALVTVVLAGRRDCPRRLRHAVALLVGLALVTAWTTLTFPTFTIPRYSTPVVLCTILLAVLGVPLWPRRVRPLIPATLLVVFLLGAWSPTDPVTRAIWGTTSVGGQRVYDTAQRDRGPDRIVVNFAALRASADANARLRQIFASDAELVTGECDTLKLAEKLAWIGAQATFFYDEFPGARPLRCVPLAELPADAATGAVRIALVRNPEDVDARRPPELAGPAIVLVE